MRTTLSSTELGRYVAAQLSSFFPDRALDASDLSPALGNALERTEHCFSRVNQKYFRRDGVASFDHLHTDQYAMFLYLLSNSMYRMETDPRIAAKVYALNKALHGVDVYYEVELPPVFAFQHPVGTVLGRATYGNYFFAYQRCSVGASVDGAYPTIGEGVVMFGGSAIIGKTSIGNDCWISIGATILDAVIPPHSVVFGQSPSLTVRPTDRDVLRDLFRVE